MEKFYIYTLTNPKTDMVFYVGLTNRPETRLKHHCYNNVITGPVAEYTKRHGILPVMHIIESHEANMRRALMPLEEYWIQQFYVWGFDLVNQKGKPKSCKRFPVIY